MAREALPPYISKDTADSVLFIGKAMRVLKQSSGSCREPGTPHCCTMQPPCQILADIHYRAVATWTLSLWQWDFPAVSGVIESQVLGMCMRKNAFVQAYAGTDLGKGDVNSEYHAL